MNEVAKYFCILIGIFQIIKSKSEINVDLVFNLQDYFKSDVILIVTDHENEDVLPTDKLVKKFYKFHHKVFVATINFNSQFFIQNFKKDMLKPYQNTMIVFDSTTKFLEKFINFHYLLKLVQIIWICFTDDDVAEKLYHFYIPYNSKFFLIRKNGKIYDIEDVHQINKNSTKIITKFGNFEKGTLNVPNGSFYFRRKDLRGRLFNVSLPYFPEYAKKWGYLWELLAEGMNSSVLQNFTTELNIEDVTVYGLYQLLNDHKIDGTSLNYIISTPRLDPLDHIFPTIVSKALIYVSLQAELNWTSYIAPFPVTIWISIVTWIILFAIILHVSLRSKNHPYRTFMDSLFETIQAISDQGGDYNISSLAIGILYLMPYLLSIILVQYYSGQLLSNIAVQNLIMPFRTLNEAIEDGTYKVITLKEGFYEKYFRINQGPEATAVRDKELLESLDKMPVKHSDGFHKLCGEKYIHICPSAIEVHVAEDCHIEKLNTVLFYESWGILVRKGFPFKNDLTRLMRQIQFSGLWKLYQNNIIISKNETNFEPLSLQLIFPIFLLYWAVIIICGFILLCEILRKRRENQTKFFRRVLIEK